MSNSGGVITAPVSIADVQKVLSVSDNNIGALCKSGEVNKWAIYKPVPYASLTSIDLANIQSVHCGLSPNENIPLFSLILGANNTPSGSYTNEQAETQSSKEWTAVQPTGGISSPYRLTDFNGYDHRASACDNGASDIQISIAMLQQFNNVNVDISHPSSTDMQYNWEMKSSGITFNFTNFYLRFSTESWANINGAPTNAMPLTYVTGNQLISEYWRIGVAVWIPKLNKYILFVSPTPLKSTSGSSNMGAMLPNLFTNTMHIAWWIDDFGSTSSKTYKAIMCMVKNTNYTRSISGSIYKSGLSLDYNTAKIYTMPSGKGIFNITVTKEGTASVSVTFVSATVEYMNLPGGTYTFNKDGVSTWSKPSSKGSSSAKITLRIRVTGTLPTSWSSINIGMSSSYINNNATVASNSDGSYTLTAIDNYYGGAPTPLVNQLNGLPTYTGASGTTPIVNMSIRFKYGVDTYTRSVGTSEMHMK